MSRCDVVEIITFTQLLTVVYNIWRQEHAAVGALLLSDNPD